MAFASGQWGPDTFIDSAGNTTLIGATVTATGYVCTVDALGNLTVTGPAADSVVLTVTPAVGAVYTQTVRVEPLVTELEAVQTSAAAAVERANHTGTQLAATVSDFDSAAVAAGSSTYSTVVEHGATAATARPAGAVHVQWIGTVTPANAATDDEWLDTSTAPATLNRHNGTAFESLGGSAAADTLPVFTSGSYYGVNAAPSSGANGAGTFTVTPLVVPAETTFDRIRCEVTTAAAGGLLRLGIYATTNGQPSALVLDAGTVDAGTAGIKDIVISQTLTPGVYWLAALLEGATIGTRNIGAGGVWLPVDIGSGPSGGFYKIGVAAGALPNPISGVLRGDSVVRVIARAL